MANCMYFYMLFYLVHLFDSNEVCLLPEVEAFQSIMAHFKTQENICHRSFTTTIGNANFTTR